MKISYKGIQKLPEQKQQKIKKIAEDAAKRISKNSKKTVTKMTVEVKEDKGKMLEIKIDTDENMALELKVHWALEKINFSPVYRGFVRTIKK